MASSLQYEARVLLLNAPSLSESIPRVGTGNCLPMRVNYFVPVPQVRDLAELNARLQQQCVADRERRLRGQAGPKAELLKGDQAAFLAVPSSPFAACRQPSTTGNSLSLGRFDTNDYSVPVRWGHHPVVAKGDWQRVRLYAQGQEVAGHNRICPLSSGPKCWAVSA